MLTNFKTFLYFCSLYIFGFIAYLAAVLSCQIHRALGHSEPINHRLWAKFDDHCRFQIGFLRKCWRWLGIHPNWVFLCEGTCSCDKVVGRVEERRGPQAMVKTRNRFALEIHYGCCYNHCKYCCHYHPHLCTGIIFFFPASSVVASLYEGKLDWEPWKYVISHVFKILKEKIWENKPRRLSERKIKIAQIKQDLKYCN